MLEFTFARILALLGEGTGLTFYVNCVVAAILFLCCLVFFFIMVIGVIVLKNNNEELFPKKLLIIIKGVTALTLLCYIIYLLVAWNSWVLEAPLTVAVVSFVGAVIIFGVLFVAYRIGYNLIYEGIKEMVLYFKKK